MLVLLSLLARAAAWPEPGTSGVLAGLCEASSLVWDEKQQRFIVADNETPSTLFVFNADFSPWTTVTFDGKVDDIEALAQPAAGLWVVGSQSANKRAERREDRERVVLIGGGAPPWAPDLHSCVACEAARGKAPNDGGLNVEGAMVRQGQLWLGLRSPLVDGKAPLLKMNLDGRRIAELHDLDLGGLGVRELVSWRDGFLVVAGPVADEAADHELWWFSAPNAVGRRLDVKLPPSTEGLAVNAAGQAIWVTDGDGKRGECAVPSRWGAVSLAGVLP
jgi:hypothetical protein